MEVGPSAAPMIAMDGRRVFKLETEQACGKQRKKDSELRRRAEKHKLWICQQRFKINHCTDSDKQQQGEQLVRVDSD